MYCKSCGRPLGEGEATEYCDGYCAECYDISHQMEVVGVHAVAKDFAGRNIYLYQCPKCKKVETSALDTVNCDCDAEPKMEVE